MKIDIEISLNSVPKCAIDNKLPVVQIMSWRRTGNKPLSEPMIDFWRIYIYMHHATLSTPRTIFKPFCGAFLFLWFRTHQYLMNWYICVLLVLRGWYTAIEAIIWLCQWLPQCQWNNPDAYGKIGHYQTTTKHNTALTLWIINEIYMYCRYNESCPCAIKPNIAVVFLTKDSKCFFAVSNRFLSWWRHQMETFAAVLAICAGNSPVPGEFPTQRPVTRSFDVYFDLRPNKRLSKQWWGWWFETQSCPLWRHRNVCVLAEYPSTKYDDM